jgi:hypothetical protein
MRLFASTSVALVLVLGSAALRHPSAARAEEATAPRYVVGVGGMH